MADAHLKRKSEFLTFTTQSSRRQKMRRVSASSPTIKSLSEDLLIEIIAKVAAASFTDLFHTKLVAKDFLHASEDGHIFRHVSLRNVEIVPWKNDTQFWSFMEICNKNGNRESLYRKGMLEFFTYCNEASGLANLKVSAEKGHAEACYVYGIVLYLMSFENYKVEEGLEFLKRCEMSLGAKMVECRRRVKNFVRYIWINNKNKIFLRKKADFGGWSNCDCVRKNNCQRWNWTDEDNNYGEHTCETCKWSGEVLRFCNMLRTGSYN